MASPRPFIGLLLVLSLIGCTDKKETPVDPNAELRNARARLAVLAQATANGAYDAEYQFLQLPSNTSGIIRIRQSPPQYRIDISSRDAATFFALRSGVVSCSSKAKKKRCFLVALPGEEVPALFDPGVQRLFRDAVEDLAAHPDQYLVVRTSSPPTTTPTAATTAPPANPALPSGECFTVTRASTGTPTPGEERGFENGTYCFSEQGVATSITVLSGSLTLKRVVFGRPTAAAFKPPAKVEKLPDLTPTPTPSKKK